MNKEFKIDLRRCFIAVLKNWSVIAITVIVFFVLAYILTVKVNDDIFVAQTTVYSIEENRSSAIMTTYSDIITSLKVSERAASLLDDNSISGYDIQKMLKVTISSSTVISISAFSSERERAVKVVNAVAEAFLVEVHNITGVQVVQLLDKANSVELFYDSKKEMRKVRLISIIAAIAISSICVVLGEIFNSKIYHASDAELDGEIEIMGIIPFYQKKEGINIHM